MKYLIIGGGKFGRRAAQQLSRRADASDITVVDADGTALQAFTGISVERICEDGVTFLMKVLSQHDRPGWIVPAAPIHVAFEWVVASTGLTVGPWEIIPVPEEIDALVPNPQRGPRGQLYISYADFVCPDHCTEPYDRCTFTGKPRKGILYRLLGALSCPGFTSVVLRSRQLAPGVGGYRPDDLEASLQQVLAADGSVLYSTACYCHGVMDALKRL